MRNRNKQNIDYLFLSPLLSLTTTIKTISLHVLIINGPFWLVRIILSRSKERERKSLIRFSFVVKRAYTCTGGESRPVPSILVYRVQTPHVNIITGSQLGFGSPGERGWTSDSSLVKAVGRSETDF